MQKRNNDKNKKKNNFTFLKSLFTTNEFSQSIDDIYALHLHQRFDKRLDCEARINLNDVFH